jgi:sugar phosphate isomerase/epimerase
MQIFGHQLGVQSWCFRTYKTTDAVIEALGRCGLDALELCGVHLDVTDAAAVDAALAQYAAAGVTITTFGISSFRNDEAAVRPLFTFAQKAGIAAIGADVDLDALPLLERLCDETGVKLAIHNHGRKHRYGTFAQLDALFAQCSKNIGICVDTAWMLDAGEDPIAAIARYADRLYGVHIKDFAFRRDGSPEDVIVGTGNLNLPRLFAALEAANFSGAMTLEYEGDEQNPVPAITQCVAALAAVDRERV